MGNDWIPWPGKYTVALICAGVGVGSVVAVLLERRRRLIKPWIRVGTLSEIFLHPIKSCKAMAIPEAVVEKSSLRNGEYFDRRFVVTDGEGNFLTARDKPRLVLIELKLDNGVVTLTAPGIEPVKADLNAIASANGTVIRTKLWFDMPIDGFDCGKEISRWLTRFLGNRDDGDCQYRLLYHTPGQFNSRSLMNFIKFRYFTGKRRDLTIFQDYTAFMLMTEASQEDLNTRFKDGDQISVRNFRPNFVVAGTRAYDEDNWNRVKIGEEVELTNVKGCTRCVLTTINWATGEKHPKGEPLKTLSSYRRVKDAKERKYYGNGAVLGIHLAVDKTGAVKEGDPVYVQYK